MKNGNEKHKNCQDLYIFKMVKGKCREKRTVKPVKCYKFPSGSRYHLNIELGIYLFSRSDVARMKQLFMKVYIYREMIVWPFSTMLNRSSAIKKGFPFIMTRQPSIYFYDYVAIVRYDTFNRKKMQFC